MPNAPNNPCCSHTRGSSGLWTCSGGCLCSHVAAGSVFALSGTSFLCCKTHYQSLLNNFQRKKSQAAPRVFLAPVKILQNSAAALLLQIWWCWLKVLLLSISDEQLPLLTVKARVCLLFDCCTDFTHLLTGIHLTMYVMIYRNEKPTE